jgi:hypothetical protein
VTIDTTLQKSPVVIHSSIILNLNFQYYAFMYIYSARGNYIVIKVRYQNEDLLNSLVYNVKVIYTYLFCHLFFLKCIFYDGPDTWECFHESDHRTQK